jgi:hypothetical protein
LKRSEGSSVKWDRIEKVYAAIMYVTETLAVLSMVGFIAYRDPYIGIVAVMLTILTATLHLMLLTYHRTRLILENLTTINNKNHTEDIKQTPPQSTAQLVDVVDEDF